MFVLHVTYSTDKLNVELTSICEPQVPLRSWPASSLTDEGCWVEGVPPRVGSVVQAGVGCGSNASSPCALWFVRQRSADDCRIKAPHLMKCIGLKRYRPNSVLAPSLIAPDDGVSSRSPRWWGVVRRTSWNKKQ